MSPLLPSSRRRARPVRLPTAAAAGAPAVGVLAAIVLGAAVFMPWYATNLGPPFSAVSASGWDATDLARIALLMAVALAAACLVAMLDERGVLRLDHRSGDALAWVAVAASAIALVMVAYRLVVLPEPAEFLSREIGLYLAGAAAVVGILSGLAQLAERR